MLCYIPIPKVMCFPIKFFFVQLDWIYYEWVVHLGLYGESIRIKNYDLIQLLTILGRFLLYCKISALLLWETVQRSIWQSVQPSKQFAVESNLEWSKQYNNKKPVEQMTLKSFSKNDCDFCVLVEMFKHKQH